MMLGIGVLSPKAHGQAISRLIRTLVTPTTTQPHNLIFVDTTTGQQNRMRVANLDSVKRQLMRIDSIYVATRALDDTFKPSATRNAIVIYSVSILSNAGNTGTVFLEYSSDESTWVEASRAENKSNGVGNTQISVLAGMIPANYFVRIRTSGAATITFISGQETLL